MLFDNILFFKILKDFMSYDLVNSN